MEMFMDPTYDFIFKELFGEVSHINLTKSLVNALCRFPADDQVEIAKFLNREQIPGGSEIQEARTFVDIYCETTKGHKFIIEMQREPDNELLPRLVLYLARMFSRQYQSSKSLKDLHPVIVIAIANKIPELAHINNYRSAHFLCDDQTHQRELKQLGLILIDLSKFEKNEHEVETNEEKWILFFKIIGSATSLPKPFQTGEFKEACDVLNLMTKDGMYRMEYENLITGIESMKRNKKIEKELAEAKAEAKGLAKGKAEGELKAKIELAKKLLKKMSPEEVAALTGLSLEELAKL